MAAAGNSTFVGSLYMSLGLESSSFVSGFVAAKAQADQASKQIRNSMRAAEQGIQGARVQSGMLGQQIADVGVQLSMGTNPFMIISQQAPQVALALQNANGAMGKFARFLTGPLGAATLAVGAGLGVFVSNLIASRNEAEKTEKATKDLTERMRELGRVAEKTFAQQAAAMRLEADRERGELEKERKRLLDEQKRLRDDIARMRSSSGLNSATATMIGGMEAQARGAEGRLREISDRLRELDEAGRALQVAEVMRDITAATDEAARINQRYEDQSRLLQQQQVAGAITLQQFAEQETRLRQERDAALEAIRERASAERSTTREIERQAEAMQSLIDSLLPVQTAYRTYTKDLDTLNRAFDAGKIRADQYAEAIRNLRERMLDDIGLEQAEASIANWKPGKAARPQLDDSYTKERAAEFKRVREEMRKTEQQATIFTAALDSAFNSALFSGESLGDVFQGLVNDIGQMAAKMLILQPIIEAVGRSIKSAFGGAGIFGIFGGARANGGPVDAGKTYLVGERGPELFTPSRSGSILPNGALAGGATGIEVVVSPSPYFDVRVQKTAAPMVVSGALGATATAMAETKRRDQTTARLSLAGA